MEVAGIITIHKIVEFKAKEKKPEHWVTKGKTNIGMLEVIVEKPDLELHGQPSKYDTPIRKDSCMMEGIARLHPFTDGNKRTSLYTAYAYLQKEHIDLDLKLIESGFLVHIATDKSRTEEEIDTMIAEIEVYLIERIKIKNS